MVDGAVTVYRKLMSWRVVVPYCVLLLIALVVLGRGLSITFLPSLAPQARDALSVMWQVHATIVSIGFAGLAITFQLLSDPPVSAGPARRSVIERIRFGQLLMFGIASDLATGAAAIWFPSDANVLLMFFLAFLPSIVAIAVTYGYSAYLFVRPHEMEQLTVRDLISSVKKNATQVAGNRVKNFALAEFIKDIPHVTLHGIFNPVNPECSIHYQGRPGIVRELNFNRIKEFSVALSATIAVYDTSKGKPGYLIAHIRIRVGDRVDPRTVLADLYNASQLSETQRERLAKMLSGAISLTEGVNISVGESIVRELADLQEHVISAIQSNRYGRVKRGFDYYGQIISAVRGVVVDHSEDSAFESGNDSRALITHLWEVNDIAVRAGERLAIEATEAAYGRCSDALHCLDVDFFSSSIRSYQQIWSALLPKDVSNKNALEYLLVSLQNLTEYTIPWVVIKDESRAIQFARTAANTWLEIVKEAYDEGSKTWASRALGYQSELFRYNCRKKNFRDEVQQSAIVLIAWLLYRQEVQGAQTAIDVKGVLDKAFFGSVLTDAVITCRRENSSIIRRWEMQDSLPLQMREVRASEFLAKAAILVLAKSSNAVPVNVDSDLHDFAMYALSQVDSLRNVWDPDWGVPSASLDLVEELLREIARLWGIQTGQH